MKVIQYRPRTVQQLIHIDVCRTEKRSIKKKPSAFPLINMKRLMDRLTSIQQLIFNSSAIAHVLANKISARAYQVPEIPRTTPTTAIPTSEVHPFQPISSLKTSRWNTVGKTKANPQQTLLPINDKKSAKFGTSKAVKLTTKTSNHLDQMQ